MKVGSNQRLWKEVGGGGPYRNLADVQLQHFPNGRLYCMAGLMPRMNTIDSLRVFARPYTYTGRSNH